MKITEEIVDLLKSYVYMYIDPRNGEPFYIGKGKGNRLFAHIDDQSDSEKVAKIAEIKHCGLEPQIDILRYGLSESEASLVEAAAIDLLGKAKLTNRILGYHKSSFGRISSQDLIEISKAKPVEVHYKAILFTINRLYRSAMTPLELYETTRGVWKLGKRREKAEYAMTVTHGIVREVYHIEQWFPAGTLDYQTRDFSEVKRSGRWEFSGEVASDIRDEYIGFSVGKAGQNPIRYRNI
jgi:uncharacterized protein